MTKRIAIPSIFLTNVSFTGLATLVCQGLTFLLFVLAARALGPSDLGQFAIISVIIAYANLLGEFGGGSYLIHSKNVTKKLCDTVFTLNFIIALTLTFLVYFSSAFIADYFSISNIFSIQLASLTILFFCIGGVFKGILQRNLHFQNISLVEIIASVTSFMISLLMLHNNFGILALVAFPLIRSGLELILCKYLTTTQFSFAFHREEWVRIYDFSIYLLFNNTVNLLSRSADHVIIGKYIGDVALGFYSIAYKIMLFPVHRVVAVISKVMYPTLASQRDNFDRLRFNYVKVVLVVALLSTFLAAWVWFNTENLVFFLLGSAWSEVVPLLRILVPLAVLQSVMSTVGPLFLITGKTKYGLKLQIISTAITLIGFICGVRYGVKGVCWAYLVSNLILFYPLYSASVSIIGLSFKRLVWPLCIIIFLGFVSSYFSYYVSGMIFNQDLISMIGSALITPFFAIVSILIFYKSFLDKWLDQDGYIHKG